jgi:polysaccharide export outer membrane protein
MVKPCRRNSKRAFGAFLIGCLLAIGCHSQQLQPPVDSQVPRELAKVTLPTYVIEPPDILLVDALRVVPLPPYRIAPLDILFIEVTNLPENPIQGNVTVDSDGTISLGADYGKVILAGKTLDEAKAEIEKQLKQLKLKDFKVTVLLTASHGLQQIRGEHLVHPDGVITLGNYGSVYVTGMTIPEAKAAIEEHLTQFLVKPEISVDILAFNSKVYYIITDGAGYGQQIIREPITGNETVLDAISKINGLPPQSSKHVWIARPAPPDRPGCNDQILPVDWRAIVECGQTATNFQVLPGDRVYVKADSLITLDNWLAKITNPMQRLFSTVIIGNAMVQDLHGGQKTGSGGAAGGGL